MAISLADFKVKFPELALDGSSDSDAFLQKHLDDALVEFNVSLWGSKLDVGHGYLTAHNIAISPWGQTAKLANNSGETTYWHQYKRLMRQVAAGGGARVATKVTQADLYAAGSDDYDYNSSI